VDRVHGSGGPRPGSDSRVHGGPRAAVAKRLTRARARGRSDEQMHADGGGKRRGNLGGFLPWVRVGGAVPEGAR
jgi:hypothetical protein